MKITPILENEKLRETTEDFAKVYLYKEGKFYRAFNESAFLIKRYICTEEMQKERGDKSILQTPRYQTKSGEYVIAGFPIESFSKYIVAYKDVQSMDNDNLVVTIDETLFGEDATPESLHADYEEWVAACPVKDRSKNRAEVAGGNGQQAALARSGLFSIVSEILAYGVDTSTPIQNIEFISRIKSKLVQLL